MSVSGTDRARFNQRLTETREEAEEREAKLLLRKNEQLKRAEQRHQKELARLNDSYRNQLSSIREQQMETLSERDSDYQAGTERLRKQYSNQIQKKYENSDLEKSQIKDNYENRIAKQKEISEMQKENLLTKQKAEIKNRDSSLTEISTRSQEKMKQAIDNNSKRMRNAHEKEMVALRASREKQLRDAELEKLRTRDAFEGQVDSEKAKNEYQEANWRTKYNALYEKAFDPDNSEGPTRSQMLKAELENIENRYSKKYEQKANQMEENRNAFEQTVSNRVNNQVKSRDLKIATLQNKVAKQAVDDRRLRSMEQKNLTNAYEDKIGDLENQKSQIQEVMQDLNAERIGKMKQQNEGVLRMATTDYRSQAQIEKARNQEYINQLELMQNENLDRVQTRAESRVEKLERTTNQTTQKLTEFFNESIDLNRDGFERKIVDQREKNLQLQSQNQKMMSEKFRKLEKSFTQRLDSAVETYETKLQEMKDRHEKEIRSVMNQEKIKSQDREKGHRTERDSLEMKYESKLAMIQEQHQEQLDRIQSRHQQDMRDLAVKMNQYKRKA